eukprot:s1584_g9.t1
MPVTSEIPIVPSLRKSNLRGVNKYPTSRTSLSVCGRSARTSQAMMTRRLIRFFHCSVRTTWKMTTCCLKTFEPPQPFDSTLWKKEDLYIHALSTAMKGRRWRTTWSNETRRDVACVALGSLLTLAIPRQIASNRSVADFVQLNSQPAICQARANAAAATAQVPAPRFGQMPILTAVGTGVLAVWRGRKRGVAATPDSFTDHEGKVKSYNKEKGFGFIECATTFSTFRRDVFLHKQQAEGLEVGDAVSFEVAMNAQGNPQARNDAIDDAWAAVDAEGDIRAAEAETAQDAPETDPFADAWAMAEAEKEVPKEVGKVVAGEDESEARFLGQGLGTNNHSERKPSLRRHRKLPVFPWPAPHMHVQSRFCGKAHELVEEQPGDENYGDKQSMKSNDLKRQGPTSGIDTDRQAKIRALALEIRSKSRQHEAKQQEKQELVLELEEVESAPRQAKFKFVESWLQLELTTLGGLGVEVDGDGNRLEAKLPALEQKVLNCQDEVERVEILAAPLASMEAMSGLQDVLASADLQLSAVRDTERAVKATRLNLEQATKELDNIRSDTEALPNSKDYLVAKILELAEKLQAASLKLDEHKHVRRDYELAKQADKVWSDLASRLATVEMDCEKAVTMADPAAKAPTATDMHENKEAIRIAQAKLAPTARLIAGKVGLLKGHAKTKMAELLSRAEAAQASLEKAQKRMEEAQSHVAAIPLLKQASERLAVVEQVVEKMRDTEAPFLMGIENLQPEDAVTALEQMDKAAASALTSLADAHKYVGLKLVEAGRLAEATAESTCRDLEKVKQQLDANISKVRKFQADTSERRRNVEQVGLAEAVVQKLQALAGNLRDSNLEKLSECLEQTHREELQAQSALTAARREVQDRQQELRNSADNIASLKNNSEAKMMMWNGYGSIHAPTRWRFFFKTMRRFRKLSQEASEKLKVHSSLQQLSEDVAKAEAKVESLLPCGEHATEAVCELEKRLDALSAAVAKPDELPIKRLQEALLEAQEAQRLSQEVVDVQTGQISLEAKVELAKLQARCKAAQRKAKTSCDALGFCYQRMISESKSAVRAALRSAAKRGEGPFQAEELFTELRKGNIEVTKQDIFDFFDRYGMEAGLSEDKVQAAVEQLVPHGLTKQTFVALLCDYQRVVREINLTDSFAIQAAQQVRKLEIGELVIIQSPIQRDSGLGNCETGT